MRKLGAFAAAFLLAGCATSSPSRDAALEAALEVLTPIVRERIQARCEGKADSRACLLAEAGKEQRKRPNRKRRQ